MFESEEKLKKKSAPKTVRLLLAQLINSFIEYTSELTYFAINAFQTSSLKRVQTTTLTRFDHYCVPRVCALYYSLDREFEEFVLRMKKLCKRTQNTFLDIRSARIHYPQSGMFNIPDTHRSLNIFKCNIERLRDLKKIHQDLGHNLLLPNDQLFLSLDLLVTNFQLILCELDNQVRFKDAIVLQTFVNDIFLQCRVVLTWLYPAIKMAAYRFGDPNKQFAIKRCDNVEKNARKNAREETIQQESLGNNLPIRKPTEYQLRDKPVKRFSIEFPLFRSYLTPQNDTSESNQSTHELITDENPSTNTNNVSF
ncbi:unnamed protein product [Adineta ricciae]|uniref:Uncharacterized protein n=1 Tax=Adineta ricciae TaxID=249248 RepID=A0A814XKH9_ADIRI|nr:unnamed protein product [Adineta ricciae]